MAPTKELVELKHLFHRLADVSAGHLGTDLVRSALVLVVHLLHQLASLSRSWSLIRPAQGFQRSLSVSGSMRAAAFGSLTLSGGSVATAPGEMILVRIL